MNEFCELFSPLVPFSMSLLISKQGPMNFTCACPDSALTFLFGGEKDGVRVLNLLDTTAGLSRAIFGSFDSASHFYISDRNNHQSLTPTSSSLSSSYLSLSSSSSSYLSSSSSSSSYLSLSSSSSSYLSLSSSSSS